MSLRSDKLHYFDLLLLHFALDLVGWDTLAQDVVVMLSRFRNEIYERAAISEHWIQRERNCLPGRGALGPLACLATALGPLACLAAAPGPLAWLT